VTEKRERARGGDARRELRETAAVRLADRRGG
jgi:hypothetical protein